MNHRNENFYYFTLEFPSNGKGHLFLTASLNLSLCVWSDFVTIRTFPSALGWILIILHNFLCTRDKLLNFTNTNGKVNFLKK
jgi:hypothetical protein